jgi:hypothetical protein
MPGPAHLTEDFKRATRDISYLSKDAAAHDAQARVPIGGEAIKNISPNHIVRSVRQRAERAFSFGYNRKKQIGTPLEPYVGLWMRLPNAGIVRVEDHDAMDEWVRKNDEATQAAMADISFRFSVETYVMRKTPYLALSRQTTASISLCRES